MITKDDFLKIRVLLTDGGGRQTLTIVHDLLELGCEVTVLCSSKLDLCYASKLPIKKVLDRKAGSGNAEFEDFIIQTISSGDYDILIPIAEKSTDKITLIENEVKKYVKLACAPRESYINAFDKQRTFELATTAGIPVPKTRMSDQKVEDYLNTVHFPLIIKPRNGMGSIGFHKFENEKDFWTYVKNNNVNLDNYVLQEFVKYKRRYGTILFVDQSGNVCMSYADEVLREYPIDAGSACLIRSIDAPEVLDASEKLLKAMNWHGVAALSFMVDSNTGEAKLLEVNGRIPASIRLSHQCGFNVGKLLIEMALGEAISPYPPNKVFGQLTRHSHADFLWFLHSPERFNCEPSWFSWKNTKDVVYWKGDIGPWIAYTKEKIAAYKEFKRLRAR